MKIFIQSLCISTLYLFSFTVYSQNQVIFFYIAEELRDQNKQDVTEIHSDLFLYINNIKPWLHEKGIKYDLKDNYNFTVNTNNKNIKFTKAMLSSPTGYVIVKSDGNYVISSSFGTGVDMMMHISKYLGIKAF